MKFLVYFVLIFYNHKVIGQNYLNYVCNSYIDYWKATRDTNSNCKYSGDVFNSFEEIASSYGYNVQSFEVTTEDEYILKLFRIFPKGGTSGGPPILLQHGSTLSATGFMMLGNNSLAFILANEGYDVWMGNFRGTTYSSGHKILKLSDNKYWDYSFHEFGFYDLKAFLDLVTIETKQKVIYIGYSVGSRAYNVYNSMRPEEANAKLRVSISLAPTAFMGTYNKSPILKSIGLLPHGILKTVLGSFYQNGVFQLKTTQTTKKSLHFCLDGPFRLLLCELAKSLLLGFQFFKEAPETLPVLLGQGGEPGSLKDFYHAHQLMRNKQFQQFDYGIDKNLEKYGTMVPPIYNFSKITVPNYLVYSSGDFMATGKGTRLIYEKLPEKAKPFGKPYKVNDGLFNHNNFISARDVKTLVYDHILMFLRDQSNYFNN